MSFRFIPEKGAIFLLLVFAYISHLVPGLMCSLWQLHSLQNALILLQL